jgi:acyl-coenzyme A thioesterase PaaI-like protein
MASTRLESLADSLTAITLIRIVRRYLTSMLLFAGVVTGGVVFVALESAGVPSVLAVLGALLGAVGVVVVLFRFAVLPVAVRIEGVDDAPDDDP